MDRWEWPGHLKRRHGDAVSADPGRLSGGTYLGRHFGVIRATERNPVPLWREAVMQVPKRAPSAGEFLGDAHAGVLSAAAGTAGRTPSRSGIATSRAAW